MAAEIARTIRTTGTEGTASKRVVDGGKEKSTFSLYNLKYIFFAGILIIVATNSLSKII